MKTTEEIFEYWDNFCMNLSSPMSQEDSDLRCAEGSEKWYSKREIKIKFKKYLNSLNRILSDKDLPDFVQANISGGIIYLEDFKNELFGDEE